MWRPVLFVFAVIAVSVAQPPPECMNPPNVNPETCCPNAPQFVSKQMMDECASTNGQFSCETSNCILRIGNFLTTDGKVDRTAVSNYAIPAEWTSVANAAIQSCFSEINGASCESMKFIGCMAHYLMNNCPASVWNDSAECAAVKAFVNNCRPPSL